jgi:DNA-binding CsgD family transcriptional regulator
MAILEAVYRVECPRSTWFTGVLAAVAAALKRGDWVGGVLYDVSRPRVRLDDIGGVGMPEGWLEIGKTMHQDPRLADAIVASYRATVCTTLPELESTIHGHEVRRAQREYYGPRRVPTQTMINGLDGSGKGCCLYLFSRNTRALTPRTRQLFGRLATHLATGYRLQRRLAADPSPETSDIQAVLEPDGHIAHAEVGARAAPAREALAFAVRAREGIRRQTPAEPAPVLRSWRGLVAARWTLVDHFERGGRRFVLARENAPMGRGPAALSMRERQVASLAALGRSNKLIAYELGLAHSTIRVIVARACAKLGVSSRRALVARLTAS